MNMNEYLTTDNLQDVVSIAKKPVLVDMYAEWCGPCKMIGPIIDNITEEYQDKIDVIKVNVDENPVSAAAYGIRTVPTLLVFNNGELVKKHSGAIPKSKIVELFEKYI